MTSEVNWSGSSAQAPGSLPPTQARKKKMKKVKKDNFPPGWDEKRVRRVLEYYEQQTQEEAVAEDEAPFLNGTGSVMEVPYKLVPTIRELIAKHQG